jgi:hypothetical protein
MGGFQSRKAIPLSQVSDVRLFRHPFTHEDAADSATNLTTLMILFHEGERLHLPLHVRDHKIHLSRDELTIDAAPYSAGWASLRRPCYQTED